MRWAELLGLISFTFAGSGSPGPNNTLLLASGVNFGFRSTVPHVAGAALGVGVLVLSVAAGIGTVVERFPGAQLALKTTGSLYLLYLAFRSRGHGIETAAVTKPLNVWEAFLFQFVNPKAWLLAIGVAAAFIPASLPALFGAPLVAGIFATVSATCFMVWCGGGAALARVITDDRKAAAVNYSLAVLLVASIGLIWI